jgi:hypothetical protein
MLVTIDPKKQMVVDLSSFGEVPNALAVDLDAKQVMVIEGRNDNKREVLLSFPAGIVVRRR